MTKAIKYGTNYKENLDVVEISKIMRKEIKRLIAEKKICASYKYSVKTERFAGGSSIDISVKTLLNEDRPARVWDENDCCWKEYTPELQKTYEQLKLLHRSYNFDGSDSMSDYFFVKYYGGVKID